VYDCLLLKCSPGIISCVVVPLTSFEALGGRGGALYQGTGLFGTLSLPPLNATWTDGFMTDPAPGTVCGGRGDYRATSPDQISLCQSLAFTSSMGSIAFWFNDIPVLHGVTMPAIFLLLAFPFRYYMVAIAAPLLGSLMQVYTVQQSLELTANISNDFSGQYGEVADKPNLYPVVVLFAVITTYGMCISTALMNERYSRSIFLMKWAHSERRNVLLSTRQSTRFVGCAPPVAC